MQGEVVGTFTLLYELIADLIKGIPHLFRLFAQLPFIVQQSILLIFACFVVPKIVDFIAKIIEWKKQLDDKL